VSDSFDEVSLRGNAFLRTVEVHAELGSTNDRARELIAGDAALPALVVAERQTAGRGRGANRWWSTDGALTFSIAINAAERGLTIEQNGLVSLATAVAIVDSIRETTGLIAGVKWPNDVYLDDKKLAGILIESPRPGRLVIGVGINVTNSFDDAPTEVRDRATSLVEYAPAKWQAVLVAFLGAINLRLTQIVAGDPSLIDAARVACVLTGKIVTLRDGERITIGECIGVADDGALRLKTDGVETSYYAGTIERGRERLSRGR
jgi:BirA family biotin operon repressor/biotin-[acetyl-CoA-carboxylase] ligase